MCDIDDRSGVEYGVGANGHAFLQAIDLNERDQRATTPPRMANSPRNGKLIRAETELR